MKCLICHSEDVVQKTILEEIHHGKDIVQIEATAMVCNACGERYYDRKTMQQLENARNSLAQNKGRLTEVGKVLAYHQP